MLFKKVKPKYEKMSISKLVSNDEIAGQMKSEIPVEIEGSIEYLKRSYANQSKYPPRVVFEGKISDESSSKIRIYIRVKADDQISLDSLDPLEQPYYGITINIKGIYSSKKVGKNYVSSVCAKQFRVINS